VKYRDAGKLLQGVFKRHNSPIQVNEQFKKKTKCTNVRTLYEGNDNEIYNLMFF